MGAQGAQHLFHLDAVAQPPQRHVEQKGQAQLVHRAVFGQALGQGQQHPVDLGPQGVVVLGQQGLFHLLGVKIGHPGGALLLHLGEEIHRLLPGKSALLGAAVGLLVGLGQHPRLGAQVADPGRKGHPQPVPHRPLDGLDVGPDVAGGDLFPAAVEDHHVHPVHPRHPYVGQDHVRPAVLHPVQHLLAAGAHSRHLIAPLPPGQAVGHAVAYIFLVVRNDQPVHRRPPVGPCCFGAGHPKKARQKLAAQTPPLFYIYYTSRAACCTSAVFVMGWPVLPVQINISCSRVFSSAVRSARAVRAAAARHWAGVWPVSFLKTRHR